jgi:hypothetical protein
LKKLSLILLVVFLLLPAMLFSQDKEAPKNKFGLTFPTIGAIWHITDNVAFLPGFSFGHNWGSSRSALIDNGTSKNNSLSINSSLRFYVYEMKGLRLYVSPKYSYNWNNSDSNLPTTSSKSSRYAHSIDGSWGLQYAISRRVSIWGDVGVGYSHSSISSNPSSVETKSNAVSTVGSWGLIFYLK